MSESAKDGIRMVLFTTLLLLIFAFSYQGRQVEKTHRVVPACQEDAVLIGAGDFDGGRWDWYECGPAVDDFTGD